MTIIKYIFKKNILSPKNDFIRKQIIMMIESVNSHINDKNYEEQQQAENASIQLTQLKLKERSEFEIGISIRTFAIKIQIGNNLMKIIKTEMSLLEYRGVRWHHLELVFKYLMSTPSTSIEPERAFLTAAHIRIKLRSRLGNDILDALLFLCLYFQNIKNKYI